ncbi:hypothetical protein [Microseira wollei]|uniref:Uncharacterized protein n=1 Tax=Microseira wollei NIES-4236 TaxID=2530354 RepID=A0AAV3X9P3_9CYAN|nr:hypothetical protein [Microseira wollei]GET37012.1 hypothetical protein MiSe_17650 [Microseira wollei NIES-4236]
MQVSARGNMEEDLSKDLEIIARVMGIAEAHEISLRDAFNLYKKQLEVKAKESSERSERLKARLGSKRWDFLQDFVKNLPSEAELLESYQQVKAKGLLKTAKLRFDADVYVENLDFVGDKTLKAGTIVEVEWCDDELCKIWFCPGGCEFMLLDELELMS